MDNDETTTVETDAVDESATESEGVQVETDAEDTDSADTDDADGDDGEGDEGAGKHYSATYVEKLRRENARRRASHKKDVEDAANTAREEFARDLGKALGFIDDDEEDQVDFEELVTKANAERDAATKKVRRFEIRDAVRSAADAHKGDTGLLLPYLRGEGVLDDLDPTDEDFADTVDALVEDAIAKNPKLKAGSDVARRSGGDLSGGNNKPKAGPQSVDEIRKARSEYRKREFGLR